ncbi:beta galactosidase jelly roll domain-containing protein [bacterium]|nr:beta galactosidase jelly roll domain-containing protein [bacterium]
MPYRISLVLTLLMLIPLHAAYAFGRDHAYIVNEGWQLALTDPLTDIVRDRQARPDWPYLSPEIHDLVSPDDNRKAPDTGWLPAETGRAWEHYGGPGYNGAGWYLNVIDIPQDYYGSGMGRLWLEFDAVSTAAAVWCNGHYLGGHVGDYTRWRVELTEYLTEDPSFEILVYVDELPFHTTQGFLSMIAPHHGGIWQDVRMYVTGPACAVTDSLHIQPDPVDGNVHLSFDLDTQVPMDQLEVQVFMAPLAEDKDIFEHEVQVLDLEIAEGTVLFHVRLDDEPVLWSPDNPQMYGIYIALRDREAVGEQHFYHDAFGSTFAFRTIEMVGHQVLLNGEPIHVRSGLQWGYYPGLFGPVPQPGELRNEFAYLKSLGFNSETVCLVNMPDYYYDIADEMGVLIWQEYPSWHVKFQPGEERTLQRQYSAFLRRDRHHPSIIMRSLSVEAGVEDWDVMSRLYDTVSSMCDTPVQDNNSWFSHSRPEYTDWYGEDNYFNNYQWERHLVERLPKQLLDYPDKPYIIGESLLCNTWVDADKLLQDLEQPLSSDYTYRDYTPGDYLGNDNGSQWPWWFPSCFDSVLSINDELRGFYAGRLPEGEDIVNDYLLPQSTRASLNLREFQIRMLFASPRYAGYTVNVVRDMPLIRAGLIDDLGYPRWFGDDWDWHGEDTEPAIRLDLDGNIISGSSDDLLLHPADGSEIRTEPFLVMEEGYLDLHEMLGSLPDGSFATQAEILAMDPATAPPVVSSVLTHDLVEFMQAGGRVFLVTSKMPGALGAMPHFFWRDALFVPPVGPFGNPVEMQATANQVVDWQGYDLNRTSGNVIPVDTLGIRNDVDPLIRLFDTHDLSEVQVFDQLWGTHIGDGTLVASSIDMSTHASHWILARIISYLELQRRMDQLLEDKPSVMLYPEMDWPHTSLSLEQAHGLAVARANGIIDITPGWHFSLDQDGQGESLGWQAAGFDDSAWDMIDAGKGWESAGYSYDGLAWYRRSLTIPADWQGGKVRLVAEGIDDAYTVFVNGKPVGTHGSYTEHELTVWLQQTVTDLTDALEYGSENTIAIQVMDITGQGGIWRPIYLAVE